MRLKKESVYSVYKVLFDIVYYVEMVVVSILLADFSLRRSLKYIYYMNMPAIGFRGVLYFLQ